MTTQVNSQIQIEQHIAVTLAAAEQTLAQRQRDADDEPPQPDPIDQALTLIDHFSRGERLNQYCKDSRADDEATIEMWNADDRTLVLASVGIAIAHHLSRLADAVEARCE